MAFQFTYPVKNLNLARCDGDTIFAELDLGCHIYLEMPVRLIGVDSPEESVSSQRKAADAVKAARSYWLAHAPFGQLRVQSITLDKYGRILGNFEVDWHESGSLTLTDFLEKNQLVHTYDGKGPRPPWTDEELTRIENFISPPPDEKPKCLPQLNPCMSLASSPCG